MNVKPKVSGIAGILTGFGLAGEFLFFMASGYSPEIFSDPIAALAFLRDRGTLLRLAVLFGALSVAARTLFVVGLASRLQAATPSRAAATLYFGLLGGIGGLVALSFYVGTPMFVELAGRDQMIAANAWSAFIIILSGFEGLGNFMLGLMLLAVGSAIITHKALPVGAGWAALLVGLMTIVRVFSSGTPLAGLAFAVFFPTLILAIVFDIWAGIALWQSESRERSRTAGRAEAATN